MIEPFVMAHVVKCAESAALGVGRAVHATVDARVHHKPGAHEARFERHVHRATGKAPAFERTGSFEHGAELGMSRGIGVDLPAIMRAGDHLAFMHDHRAYGNLA